MTEFELGKMVETGEFAPQEFSIIQRLVGRQFAKMAAGGARLYITGVSPETLWETYLGAFPPGSNPIHVKNSEHDCSACRYFIKNLGGVVAIGGASVTSLWDFEAPGAYGAVARAMAELMRKQEITGIYLHPEKTVGTGKNRQLLPGQPVKTWKHFHVTLPPTAWAKGDQIGAKQGKAKEAHDLLKRAMEELNLADVEAVLELIAQGSLYRGEENRFLLESLKTLLLGWRIRTSAGAKEIFLWDNIGLPPAVVGIRNTVIGSLLVDLAEGRELDAAVGAYEAKVAPTNYKRPVALVTPKMIQAAEQAVAGLGLTTALERRFATPSDISINNVLFADRSVSTRMANAAGAAGVFAGLAAASPIDPKKLSRVEEVGIEEFLLQVLPGATGLAVLLENRLAGNLVSLVAPADATAPGLFKWSNGFSWSYAGEVADSIKQKVKAAGGSVTGDFRASLAWHNGDDLDLHLVGPGMHISYMNKSHPLSQGQLDVDMNAGVVTSRSPVENITFPSRGRMPEGTYHLFVNQYSRRESIDVGFEVEMEFGGETWNFAYPQVVKGNVAVAMFDYTHKGGLVMKQSLPAATASKTLWGLPSQVFHKVEMICLSPNHWVGSEGAVRLSPAVGNRHWFFFLSGCVNDGVARGFYNEFLDSRLDSHRKVLEMVGARMPVSPSPNQLSGVGISSTQRNHLMVGVEGAVSRVVKVLF